MLHPAMDILGPPGLSATNVSILAQTHADGALGLTCYCELPREVMYAVAGISLRQTVGSSGKRALSRQYNAVV